MKRIAINGFGRIGRLTFRLLSKEKDMEIVAINDLGDINMLTHLLKYDSAQGNYKINEISNDSKNFIVGGKKIRFLQERDPKNLPWKELNIDLVIESTGFFTSKEKAEVHLQAGAKKVIISAPASGDLKTIVYNVNHDSLTKEDKIISGASCTTNCLAPIVKVLNDKFKIVSGFMTTIHASTNDQRVVDAPHSDLRRARSSLVNIIPTSTGAATAIGKVIPELKGKLDGVSFRVPIVTGSIVDLVVKLEKQTSVEEINSEIKKAANETLGYTSDPIVSTDIIGNTHGTIFDSKSTLSIEGQGLYKVLSWYDNEMSYVNQLVRLVRHFSKL
ncbi:MAG: glyceraldehyde-3-phosphate dehydrogenase [Candidatus Hepatoplasma vulgare]|nr:MAG: glyceraldehyde-3-phosphate dehydrogenase [Candidatus Hepatoplasma sp.]